MATISEYQQKELEVQNRFSNSELVNFFEIRPNVIWRSSHNYTEFDIALFKKELLYAVIEVKLNLGPRSMDSAKRQITSALRLTHCRFGVITDNNRFYIVDATKSNAKYVEMSFNQIVQCLIKPDIILQGDSEKDKIKKALKICFNDDIVLSICSNIIYDENQGSYSFTNIEKEREFFLSIIGKRGDEKAVYRYTSLETLFLMLNKGTYRLNGIVGMNDKSEIDYFDNKCFKDPGSTPKDLNMTYLSSCSYLEDDLTMWRLYGDDAKGVCLEFEIVPPNESYCNFVLAPVNYAEKKGEHKALRMLKALSDSKIRFAELNKWKHFFKPYDYNVEKEIRLMFFDDGRDDNGVTNHDWVKTWSHSIINPIVDFKLNSSKFPLQLKRIILGPKMPELDINKSQLKDLISSKGYTIKVDTSEIDNYR